VAEAAFCTRCGESLDEHLECTGESRPGAALDPSRFCPDCGAKLTVQVLPGGYESRCLRCERRARFASARR
jgi:uncharacterized paraquat-inducible protein A